VAVAKHMSQPQSGCNSWLNDLVRIQAHLAWRPHNSDLNAIRSGEDEAHVIHTYPTGGETFNMDMDAGALDSSGNTEYFLDAARVYDGGFIFMDQFDADLFSTLRKTNFYYPFASWQDWELGSWLLRSGLSLVAIDKFLSLELVRQSHRLSSHLTIFQVRSLPLSFRTAKELHGRAELLPSGPRWN